MSRKMHRRNLDKELFSLLKRAEATVSSDVSDDSGAMRVNWDDPLIEESPGSGATPTGTQHNGPDRWNSLETIQSGNNREAPVAQQDISFTERLRGLPKTATEFAPGIPKNKKIHKLPTVSKAESEWMFSIQEHKAKRAGKHYDLRLVQPLTDRAHSWVIPKAKLPKKKDKMLLAIQQPTHKRDYALHFTGTLGSGYGAGTVTMPIKEKITMLKMTDQRVKFKRPNGETFNLFRTKNTKWGIKQASIRVLFDALLRKTTGIR